MNRLFLITSLIFLSLKSFAQESTRTIQCKISLPKMSLEECLNAERINNEVKETCENESQVCISATVKSLKTKCVQSATVQSIALDNLINKIENDLDDSKCPQLEGSDSCEERLLCVESRIKIVETELSYINSSDFEALHPEVDSDARFTSSLAIDELSRSKNQLSKKMGQSLEKPMALY